MMSALRPARVASSAGCLLEQTSRAVQVAGGIEIGDKLVAVCEWTNEFLLNIWFGLGLWYFLFHLGKGLGRALHKCCRLRRFPAEPSDPICAPQLHVSAGPSGIFGLQRLLHSNQEPSDRKFGNLAYIGSGVEMVVEFANMLRFQHPKTPLNPARTPMYGFGFCGLTSQ